MDWVHFAGFRSGLICGEHVLVTPIVFVMNRGIRSLAFLYSFQLPKYFRMSSSKIDTGRLNGKVAIVTASTEGIGFAIAHRLGRDGASVIVSSRKQTNVDKAVAQLKRENIDVVGLVCHVGQAEDRKKLIQEAINKKGGIDILISNAAVNPVMGPILDTPEEAWDKIFDINVKAAFLLSKDCVPHMEKRGGGNIVYVSSIGAYSPISLIAPYSISKTALLGLTKAMALDCANHKIRVNCIAPGIIKTKFSDQLTNTPSISKEVLKNIPLQRFGEPEDCAGIVSFLCSDDASYITGETIVVSGGMPSRL